MHTGAASQTLVFRISCWLLGLIAFCQVIVAMISLAVRMEQNRPERIVEKIVTVPEPVVKNDILSTVPPLPALPEGIVQTPDVYLPPAQPLNTPIVADPTAEKLVNEARTARIKEDMLTAMTKLQEAQRIMPNDPTVLYELGQVHEAMGIYDRAIAFYQKVFEMGTTQAGNLYQQAADKLRDGFEQPTDKRGRISIGRVRVFDDPNIKDGQKVILTIPVQSVPGESIEGKDLEVAVNFFDYVGTQKDIKPFEPSSSKIETQWMTNPLDFTTGEELLRVTYFIPNQNTQDEHLFGERKYCGQVVTVSYKGELIDAEAYPRILAHKLNQPESQDAPLFLDQDMDVNTTNPLLPKLPTNSSGALPVPQEYLPEPER